MFIKLKRIIGIILIISFLFAGFYIGYIRITDNSPNFFGYRLLRVSSDSMEPELNVGEIVVVKQVSPEELVYGDVISYRAEKGYMKGTIVIHQISKEPYEENGVYYFTTRGIRAESVDDPEISQDQIIGEVLYKIPIVGTVYDFFTRWYGMILWVVLILIIFADDIYALIRKIRERKVNEEELEHKNINDINQGEIAMHQRLNEFDVIITNLDDPDL